MTVKGAMTAAFNAGAKAAVAQIYRQSMSVIASMIPRPDYDGRFAVGYDSVTSQSIAYNDIGKAIAAAMKLEAYTGTAHHVWDRVKKIRVYGKEQWLESDE